jgi:predicted phage baseplate assembly protein
MMLELFAFLIEIAIYQTNRVPERSLENFAELVGVTRQADEPIETTLYRALGALELKYRAVTEDEFERLALQADPNTIARAKAVVRTVDTPNVFPNEQFVVVVIVPNDATSPEPTPTDALRQTVFQFLRQRCLITTRVGVVPPRYVRVRVGVTIVRAANSRLNRDTVRQNVEQAVRNFLSPLSGGVDGKGWEFGRSVFRSELYQIIEGIDGVDHVQRLLMNGSEITGEVRLNSPTALVRLEELTVTVVDS